MNGRREYGDYQTPIEFSKKVCIYLKENKHINPSAVVEPTCGVGSFLKSSLLFNANEYYGIEINPKYCNICRNEIGSDKVTVINSDFFSFSSKELIKDKRQVLVIGNPPWVTNSALSALGSDNVPVKENFKGLKGIDAITGASNFDICEYIILKLINEYKNTNTVISMLCKTSVARNVFKELKRNYVNFSSCDILEFDAVKVFGINASACVLVIQLSETHTSRGFCNIIDFKLPSVIKSRLRYSNGRFYTDLAPGIDNYDGHCCFEWRQGVKHDCSRVMELTQKNGIMQNRQKQAVKIEDDIVFQLIKSSMFKKPVIHDFSKFVIVTQRRVREKTEYIKEDFPKTWEYLNSNIELFENRKSSIYKGSPPFSMFGIGDYTYSKYKVGVSGFYKRPLFSVLYSDNEKPVMTDDTSYFICFSNYDMAYVAMLILNSEKVQKFLTSIAFLDAKRPYTKKVLERIDFGKIVRSLGFNELFETEQSLGLSRYVTVSMYDQFKASLDISQACFA